MVLLRLASPWSCRVCVWCAVAALAGSIEITGVASPQATRAPSCVLLASKPLYVFHSTHTPHIRTHYRAKKRTLRSQRRQSRRWRAFGSRRSFAGGEQSKASPQGTHDRFQAHSFPPVRIYIHRPLLRTVTTAFRRSSRSRSSRSRSGSLCSPRAYLQELVRTMSASAGPLCRSRSASLGGSQRASHFRKPACALVRFFCLILFVLGFREEIEAWLSFWGKLGLLRCAGLWTTKFTLSYHLPPSSFTPHPTTP